MQNERAIFYLFSFGSTCCKDLFPPTFLQHLWSHDSLALPFIAKCRIYNVLTYVCNHSFQSLSVKVIHWWLNYLWQTPSVY